MTPKFLNGNIKDDLAPTTNLILLLIIPFQIILLFFCVIFECHIAGSNPKKFLNLDLNSLVKNISGRRTNACFFSFMYLIYDTETTGLPKNFSAPVSDSDNWPRLVYGKQKNGYVNYVKGANIAGFVKVADAMLAQGVI